MKNSEIVAELRRRASICKPCDHKRACAKAHSRRPGCAACFRAWRNRLSSACPRGLWGPMDAQDRPDPTPSARTPRTGNPRGA